METFIVAFALAAASGGSLVLLVCLAGKRAELVQAFHIQQQINERERRRMERKKEKSPAPDDTAVPSVSGVPAD